MGFNTSHVLWNAQTSVFNVIVSMPFGPKLCHVYFHMRPSGLESVTRIIQKALTSVRVLYIAG